MLLGAQVAKGLHLSFRKRRKAPDLGSFVFPKPQGGDSLVTVSAPEGAVGFFLTNSWCSIPCEGFFKLNFPAVYYACRIHQP